MHKIFLTVIAAFLGILATQGQVYIQTALPTAGLIQKNQLWNLVLVNGVNTPMEGKLTLVLRDRQTGLEMMSAVTGRFSLPKGSLSLNVNNLNPIQYNYMGFTPGNLFNGLLPSGAYTACYVFSQYASDKEAPLAEECVAFDVEPLSPPMLIFPADSSELEVNPSQFSWTPPTPAGMMNQLRYDILIAEIKPGQKAAEALQDNMSFYNSAGLVSNLLPYSGAMPAFEKDKWYSWQIVARDEKNYAGKSEVWVFKVKKEQTPEKTINNTPYLKMTTGAPGQGVAPNGILKLSFFNRTTDTQLRIKVEDLTAGGGTPAEFVVKAVPGENQAELKLRQKITVAEQHTYRAAISFSNGETLSVLFVIKNF